MDRKIIRSAFQLKEDDRGSFVARFSTFGIADAEGDVTLPGAMPVGKIVPISAYGHTSWQGALPVGIGAIQADNRRAWVEGRFFLDTIGGRETYQTIRNLGRLGQWSYGYRPVKVRTDLAELARYPGAHRILAQLDVFEVSPVLVGAGVDTQTEAVKGVTDRLDAELARIAAEVEAQAGRSLRVGRDADVEAIGKQLEADEQRYRTMRLHAAELAVAALRTRGRAPLLRYTYMAAEDVPPARRSFVEASAGAAAAELGIERPAIAYIRLATEAERTADGAFDLPACRGFADRAARAALIWPIGGVEQIVETVAHEVAHFAGIEHPQTNEYGRAFAARFLRRAYA